MYVVKKKTDKIYAIKKIKKKILVLKNQIIHILNEQIFMSRAKSPWIVELKASFQEDEYLYLVMEYLPGGDLMNLLIKKDILTESEAKFYLSELILAIESIHKLDCIHRDIKPDNILIDKNGHIKLSDFGLAKISDKLYEKENEKYKNYINNKKDNENEEEKMTHNKNFSCVGTAYYVAPEVLNKNGYDKDIDWWSAGIIFFEMLVGYAPFCSKETQEVCFKVLNWKKFLKIPSKIKISEEAQDLIFKMINNSDDRLGKNGAEEIKKHPFFKGVDWDNIRNTKPPFIPILKNEYDTSYFETFEINEPFYPIIDNNNKFKRKDIEYIGYTFKEELFNNDLNEEYEKAVKTIDNESKKDNIKYNNINNNLEYNNDLIFGNENIDLNIKTNPFINNNTTINNNYNNVNKIFKKERDINQKIVLNNNNLQIPFKKGSILKKGKIPNKKNIKALKLYNINCSKYKELSFKNNQNKIPTSASNNKNKLNIIQLPLKKTKPQVYYSNKVMNLINTSNSYNNTINTIDDTYNNSSNNCTYRSVKTNNYMNNSKFNNNSYIINNNMKRYLNNNSLNNSRNKIINKLNIAPIYNNKKRLSPESRENIFIKKYFLNKKLSKDKLIPTNNNLRKRSSDNNRIKQSIIKSCSSNYLKNQANIISSNRNNILSIYTPINISKNSYNSYIDNYKVSQQRPKIAYIYKKKK